MPFVILEMWKSRSKWDRKRDWSLLLSTASFFVASFLVWSMLGARCFFEVWLIVSHFPMLMFTMCIYHCIEYLVHFRWFSIPVYLHYPHPSARKPHAFVKCRCIWLLFWMMVLKAFVTLAKLTVKISSLNLCFSFSTTSFARHTHLFVLHNCPCEFSFIGYTHFSFVRSFMRYP